ncbi:ATP-binding protein, partial [Azospirillum argentinense]|uniref:ATP-binding protein n=1 Tax=Azospirillum argentinense TaxID=2970906 RepID=UPI0018DE75CF
MDRSAPKATPSSNRSAAKAKPQPQAAGLRPDQTEVFDGLLLALLARKRLLVLVGEAGSGRAAVFHQLVEQVGSDGALVLPVAASAGAQVEDLVSAAGDAALPSDSDDRDFDTLIEELEERLDLAGTGLLAVENAGVLAAPTLADLIDLTRSETPSGRFLQVLLCGTPEMERTLARPGLAEAVRELGVIYRMTPGAGPSVAPTAVIPSAGPSAGPSVSPVAGPVAAPPRAAPPPPRRAAAPSRRGWGRRGDRGMGAWSGGRGQRGRARRRLPFGAGFALARGGTGMSSRPRFAGPPKPARNCGSMLSRVDMRRSPPSKRREPRRRAP